MPNPIAPYCSALLALAYPITAYIAVARHSGVWTLIAMAFLAAAVLTPSLARGRRAAWIALPCVAGCLWLLAYSQIQLLSLYAPPVLIPAFLAWVFGHTLAADRTPLIAQLVRLLHPPEDPIDAAVWPYARRLTLAWTLLLAMIASVNLLLGLFVVPDGLLMAVGVTPLLPVSQTAWSLFANLIGYLLIAGFFLAEYAYRRRRFPRQPYRNFLDFMRRMLAAGPELFKTRSADRSLTRP